MQPNKTQLLSNWNKIKVKLCTTATKPPAFHEGEVWWTHVGENVGSELNGKGSDFLRPVLVFKKFNKNFFFGIPLTSKTKTGLFYISFRFNNKTSTASLSNAREFSSLRLKENGLLGEISQIDFMRIRTAYYKQTSLIDWFFSNCAPITCALQLMP